MSKRLDIHVEHLTRVEGHGDLVLNSKDGKIESIEWRVTEAPRFFEAFVRGRPYTQLAKITSRICGICSIGHTLASLKATEAAMGIEISEQTAALRRLALHGENMQSHVLHVGYLVSPDVFGVGSVFPLVQTRPDAVTSIIKLHRLANEFSDLICGRTTHPTNLVVGGVWKVPSESQLRNVKKKLVDNIEVANNVAEILLGNVEALPKFWRETEYIGLTSDYEYALYDGDIGSTDTGRHPVDDYRSMVNEFVVPHSTAKYCKHNRESYMVGALARFNLNQKRLSPLAQRWAEEFGLSAVNYNPFMNSIAQMVEIFHSAEDSVRIIDRLLDRGLVEEPRKKIQVKAGRGVSGVEVPRGILFHDYTYNSDGICTKANCVIPTNQNHNNIQRDLESLIPPILDRPKKEVELSMEMLVRAYDPCISCSTHHLNIKWV